MNYYQTWESLIQQWQSGVGFGKWTDPNIVPLYNDDNKKDLSKDYLPEPWWGNDDPQVLHSVVVNFNPGQATQIQEKGVIKTISNYASDIVNSCPPVLPKTRKWHCIKRAKPVIESLHRLGFVPKLPSCPLDHHLSIELIPWHTSSAGGGFTKYVDQNILNIFEYSICFAAQESRRIVNKKLNSKVIFRMSSQRAIEYLDKLEEQGIHRKIGKVIQTKSGKGKHMKFQIDSPCIKDIEFICIWGPRSRNDFPPQADMDEILLSI